MLYLRFWTSLRQRERAFWALASCVGSLLTPNQALACDLPPADSDAITVEAFPFGHAQLEQLKRDRVIYIDSPNGELRVALVAAHNHNTGERLDVSVDGLPGTITRSGPGFFASLPSRYGSLRLENNGNSTRLINEQALEQRNLPQLKDYRTPVVQ